MPDALPFLTAFALGLAAGFGLSLWRNRHLLALLAEAEDFARGVAHGDVLIEREDALGLAAKLRGGR